MHRLADHPGLGISARISRTKPCGCIYRPDAPPLQVILVLSGYRDLVALFE